MPRSLVGSRSLNKKELCQCFACKCCLQSLRALFLPKWPHLPGGAASPVFLEEDPNTPCLKQTCCMFGCREKGLQCNGSCTKRTVGGSPRENNVAQPYCEIAQQKAQSPISLTGNLVRLPCSLGKFSHRTLTCQIKLD